MLADGRHGKGVQPCFGLACVSKPGGGQHSGRKRKPHGRSWRAEWKVLGEAALAPDPTSRSMRSGLRRRVRSGLQEAITRRLDALPAGGGHFGRSRGASPSM